MKIFIYFIIAILPLSASAVSILLNNFGGYFVMESGQKTLWYISRDGLRSELASKDDLENIWLRLPEATAKDLAKIPTGVMKNTNLKDRDRDGLIDDLEKILGTDPRVADTDHDGYADKAEVLRHFDPKSNKRLPSDIKIIRKYRGQLIRTAGQAGYFWYVSPKDNKKYLVEPHDFFLSGLKRMSMAISPTTLLSAPIEYRAYDIGRAEKSTFELVNKERSAAGLPALRWNEELSAVARRHSWSLAKENMDITSIRKICDFPIIHHEGLDFGHYQDDRLNNKGIYYFSASGENIVLTPAVSQMSYLTTDKQDDKSAQCGKIRQERKDDFKDKNGDPDESRFAEKEKVIREEIARRAELLKREQSIVPATIGWHSLTEIEKDSVRSWMDSPGHKANILNKDFDEGGMGAAYINGYVILTQVFIRRADCGYKGGACCQKTGYYPYCYNPYSCQYDTCK